MPKKNMTVEERKAFGAKMAAARAAKKDAMTNVDLGGPTVFVPPVVEQILPDDYATLKQQVEELKAIILEGGARAATLQPGLSIGNGRLVGTVEKYVVDPRNYPSPVERLGKEAKLAPFAFGYNYEISFEVGITNYETKDGINTREPRFTLELLGVKLDEDGNRTNDRYIVRRAIFHEDPQAAIKIAADLGIDVDSMDEKTFLDEMRYLRMRDWLLGYFYPPKVDARKNKRQEVIGNQVVDVFEVNSVDATPVMRELNKS
jgi:hypothetical protein